MEVRDKLAVSAYKRRLTSAAYKDCPCRECYNSHDCGYSLSSGKWFVDMQCATRHNRGCPDNIPKPEHIYKSNRAKVCIRCGERR